VTRVKLLYFAWIRTRIGLSEEDLSLPDGITRVDQLVDWLASRGPGYAAALAARGTVRVAVNQEHVGLDHPVRDGDEVALFPPVTGG
jgi:molybdopterin synthase sulfur carrier subunit